MAKDIRNSCASVCFIRFVCGKRQSIICFHLFHLSLPALAWSGLCHPPLTLKNSKFTRVPQLKIITFFPKFFLSKAYLPFTMGSDNVPKSCSDVYLGYSVQIFKNDSKSGQFNKGMWQFQSIHFALLLL